MARLLRSTTQSILRKPVVLGPSVQFRPIQTKLVARPARDQMVVRAPHYLLRPPVVVGASKQFRPVKVTLVPAPRQARAAHSILRPPPKILGVTVPDLLIPLAVQLSWWMRPRLVSYKLRRPVVVGPSTQFRPLKITLVPAPRQALVTHSKLRPAPTFAAVVPPVLIPLALQLAWWMRPRLASYKLRQPIVVGPSIVFRPVSVKTTARETMVGWFRRLPHSKVRPPVVVGAPPEPPAAQQVYNFGAFKDTGAMHDRDHGRWNYDRKRW